MRAKSKICRICLLVVAAVCAPAIARAQEDVVPLHGAPTGPTRGSGSITGKVVLPSGQPVNERVRITLSSITNPGMESYTDNTGGFGFGSLGEGMYTIEVAGDQKLYEIVTQEVRLVRGMHVRLHIPLKEKAPTAREKPEGNVVSVTELEQKVPSAAKREFDRATNQVNEGRIEEAVESFKKAISIFPDYLKAHNDLGVQLLNLKRLVEAAEQFGIAIEINPRAFNPRLNLGITLVAQKRYSDAIEQISQAISIDSSSPAAHLYLGIAHVETDDLATAEQELTASLSLGDASFAIAHFYKAQIHLKRGERDEAINELETYLAGPPGGEFVSQARQLLEELKQF